jgi:hypothetical protein
MASQCFEQDFGDDFEDPEVKWILGRKHRRMSVCPTTGRIGVRPRLEYLEHHYELQFAGLPDTSLDMGT